MEAHRSRFAAGLLCQVVGLSISTCYECRPGGLRSRPSARAVADGALLERIEAIHEGSRATYGSPRVRAQLRLDGHRVGRSRVARQMRERGLQGVCLAGTGAPRSPTRSTARRRTWSSAVLRVRSEPAVGRRLLLRPHAAGLLYLAGVLDMFSRRLVGWSMSDRMTTPLVLSALQRYGQGESACGRVAGDGDASCLSWPTSGRPLHRHPATTSASRAPSRAGLEEQDRLYLGGLAGPTSSSELEAVAHAGFGQQVDR